MKYVYPWITFPFKQYLFKDVQYYFRCLEKENLRWVARVTGFQGSWSATIRIDGGSYKELTPFTKFIPKTHGEAMKLCDDYLKQTTTFY